MIKLKITESPDIDSLGVHEYFYDKILMGSRSEDLIVRDKEFKNFSAVLEATSKGVKFGLTDETISFQVNDKTINGGRMVKPGDLVKVCQTTFQLIAFAKSEKDLMPQIEKNLEKIEKLPKDYKVILNELESTLEDL